MEKTPEQIAAETAAAEAAKNEKIEFNEAQQKHVNKIVQERLTRQETALKTDFEKALNEKLEALRTELTPQENKDRGADDATKKQQRELIEAEQRKAAAEKQKREDAEKKLNDANSAIAKRDKRDAMKMAMNGVGFHSIDEVMLLTDANVELSADGKSYVVRENGVIKENSSLEPMSLEEYFRAWAQSRPWSVNEDLISGVGSAPGKGIVSTVRSRADLKSPQSKSDYIDKFGLQAYEDLPAK